MNEDNQTMQYNVIVKNVSPYLKKHYCNWVEVPFYNWRNFLFHFYFTLARNAVLDTSEYTSCTYSD